jgi:hypothetical protein
MILLQLDHRRRFNEKCSGEFRCHEPVPKKIPGDFRATATAWPTATFNLLTRFLKSGIWKSANRKFKLQMEGKEAMHRITLSRRNEPKFAAFRKIANCSPKAGVLCELSPKPHAPQHQTARTNSASHARNGFLCALCDPRSWFLTFRWKEKKQCTESHFLDETNRNSLRFVKSPIVPQSRAFSAISLPTPSAPQHQTARTNSASHARTGFLRALCAPRSWFLARTNSTKRFPQIGIVSHFRPTHTFRATSSSPVTPHLSAPPPSYGRIDPSCRI